MAFGFVIDRFALFLRFVPLGAVRSTPMHFGSSRLGLAFAAFGCALAAFGSWRYIAVERGLARGNYRPVPGLAMVVGGATFLIGALVLASLMRIL